MLWRAHEKVLLPQDYLDSCLDGIPKLFYGRLSSPAIKRTYPLYQLQIAVQHVTMEKFQLMWYTDDTRCNIRACKALLKLMSEHMNNRSKGVTNKVHNISFMKRSTVDNVRSQFHHPMQRILDTLPMMGYVTATGLLHYSRLSSHFTLISVIKEYKNSHQ